MILIGCIFRFIYLKQLRLLLFAFWFSFNLIYIFFLYLQYWIFMKFNNIQKEQKKHKTLNAGITKFE